MSAFLEILRCILCCNDESNFDRDYETLQRNPSQRGPLLESASYDTSCRSSSACNNDPLRQSDPTKIYYYEYYPNLSVSKSTSKEPNPVSSESKYDTNSLRRASEVSQNLSSPLKLPQSLAKQTPSSSKQSLSSSGAGPSTSSPTSLFPKPAIPSSVASSSYSKSSSSSLRQSLSSVEAPLFTSDQPLSSAKHPHPASLYKPSPSLLKASSTLCPSSESSSGQTPSSLKAPPSSKPTLSTLSLNSTNQGTKVNYTWVQNGTSPIYMIPEDIEDLIKKDIVPNVLKKPLSPSTYKDYFAALLYAEDFYIEKWSDFKLFNVTLKLQEAGIYKKSSKNKNLKVSDEKDDKIFVAFEIDSVPEKRPFLLSRDFIYARRLDSKSKQFKGFIYKVVKSNIVLAEFEEDFYSQHHSNRKYDISFSFNRVCLKRAHQAIAAASGPLFHDYLFPDFASRKNILASAPLFYGSFKLDLDQNSAVRRILRFKGSPPYLLKGPLIYDKQSTKLSKTGVVVQEAVLQFYQSSAKTRILICAPTNKTCDVLMGSLKEDIPDSDMFRANAAFREVDGVPVDILPFCLYERECFSCPSLQELRKFKVIFSTYVSSFRLHNEGITAGHFTHIFLVDASSTIEPEAMIALSNLANENTSVIVTGAPGNRSGWVRSDIARSKGLSMSYFERLGENKTYASLEPMFITRLA